MPTAMSRWAVTTCLAPLVRSIRHSRPEYLRLKARRNALQSLMVAKTRPEDQYKPHAPAFLTRDPAREARFVEQARAATAAAYESFVAKLEGKVGPGVTAAQLSSHRV